MAAFDLLADVATLLTGITSAIYKNELPDDPINCIGLFNTSGLDPVHTFGAMKAIYERPSFQVIVRHDTAGTARTWIESIKNAVDGKCNSTINGHYYLSIMQQGDLLSMGREEATHAILFSLNFLAEVQR